MTADDYSGYLAPANGVPNLSVDKDFDDSTSKESESKLNAPITVLPKKKHTKLNDIGITKTSTETPLSTTTSALTTTIKPTTTESKKIHRNSNQGFRGQSLISEINPDVKRTTMREHLRGLVEIIEMTTQSNELKPENIPVPSIRNGYIKIKAHTTSALNDTSSALSVG